MRVADVSAEVPKARMSVARGRIECDSVISAAARAAAHAAAILAAKDAARIVPTAVPFVLTDAYCDLLGDGAEIEVTMTVQGMARTDLAAAALAGAAAALVTLADAAGPSARITHLAIVQSITH